MHIDLERHERFSYAGKHVLRVYVQEDGWTRLYGWFGFIGLAETHTLLPVLSAMAVRTRRR